jgi:hypothetical protein
MNSQDYYTDVLTEDDVFAIRDGNEDLTNSFSKEEILILKWIESQTNTPLFFSYELKNQLYQNFTPKVLLIMAVLGAKVNYWTRFMQALGIPQAGFQKNCPFLHQQ